MPLKTVCVSAQSAASVSRAALFVRRLAVDAGTSATSVSTPSTVSCTPAAVRAARAFSSAFSTATCSGSPWSISSTPVARTVNETPRRSRIARRCGEAEASTSGATRSSSCSHARRYSPPSAFRWLPIVRLGLLSRAPLSLLRPRARERTMPPRGPPTRPSPSRGPCSGPSRSRSRRGSSRERHRADWWHRSSAEPP